MSPCGDYLRFKTIMVPERYPLPNLMDLSANMDSCTVFSKIDLVKAFHQVPLAPEDHQKTTVITPCLLACVMLLKHSKGCKTICFKSCCLFLFT
jgi:hypothetical protein